MNLGKLTSVELNALADHANIAAVILRKAGAGDMTVSVRILASIIDQVGDEEARRADERDGAAYVKEGGNS